MFTQLNITKQRRCDFYFYFFFCVDNCKLNRSSAKTLMKYLQDPLTNVNTIEFNNNPIGDEGVLTLSAGMGQLPLRTLGLVNCQISPKGFAQLVILLRTDNYTKERGLVTLDVKKNIYILYILMCCVCFSSRSSKK